MAPSSSSPPLSGHSAVILRSPTVLIVSIGLWGMNVFFFRLFGIKYRYVLNYDLMKEKEEAKHKGSHAVTAAERDLTDDEDDDDPDDRSGASITWNKLVLFSMTSLLILQVIARSDFVKKDESNLPFAVFFFYVAVLVYIIFPISSNRWMRKSFSIVLQRTYELFNPRCSCIFSDANGPRPIPFIDVFYADAMCSMSKVFADWGTLLYIAMYYDSKGQNGKDDNSENTLVPRICIPAAFAALPYVLRARQCLIMHTVGRIKNDPKRYQHLANALKYGTSIFPICVATYQGLLPDQAKGLDNVLVTLQTINASYALYWDIVMDWGMMQNPTAVVQVACAGGAYPMEGGSIQPQPTCQHVLMRPRLRFGLLLSALIMSADCVLRFSWLLKFTTILTGGNLLLVTQLLEVFRRGIWNLLRVEWENIKQQRKMGKHHHDTNASSLDDSSGSEMQPLKENDIERSPQSFSTIMQLGPKVATA
mmetsp:Transcript_16806/g.47131  ORF Transcript_16806/g.47131 Transcript_16806/m.47131 type:complete len:477 (+) Transcript_16806:152-1582(+)